MITNEIYSIRDVGRELGVAAHRIEYAHATGKLKEPSLRLAGKRVYTEDDLRRVAKYFETTNKSKEEK